MEDYEVFLSMCNFLKATTLSEEQLTKSDFTKLDNLCVQDRVRGLQKTTIALEVFYFVEECKITDNTSQSAKRKIF